MHLTDLQMTRYSRIHEVQYGRDTTHHSTERAFHQQPGRLVNSQPVASPNSTAAILAVLFGLAGSTAVIGSSLVLCSTVDAILRLPSWATTGTTNITKRSILE